MVLKDRIFVPKRDTEADKVVVGYRNFIQDTYQGIGGICLFPFKSNFLKSFIYSEKPSSEGFFCAWEVFALGSDHVCLVGCLLIWRKMNAFLLRLFPRISLLCFGRALHCCQGRCMLHCLHISSLRIFLYPNNSDMFF